MCGFAQKVSPSNVGATTSMVDFGVHLHRPTVADPDKSEDVKAPQVFIYDVTDTTKKGILLDQEFDVSWASVPVILDRNHPKTIKACVTLSDYWEIRHNEVVVNFTHSFDYNINKYSGIPHNLPPA